MQIIIIKFIRKKKQLFIKTQKKHNKTKQKRTIE